MNACIFILLTPLYWLSAGLAVIVVAPLLVLNWLLTGDATHEEGLIGRFATFACNVMTDHFATRIHRLWVAYKPVAWTFGKSVTMYRQCLRVWVDYAANNLEYRQMVKNNIKNGKNGWERKFWTIVDRRAGVEYAKIVVQSAKDHAEWKAKQASEKRVIEEAEEVGCDIVED